MKTPQKLLTAGSVVIVAIVCGTVIGGMIVYLLTQEPAFVSTCQTSNGVCFESIKSKDIAVVRMIDRQANMVCYFGRSTLSNDTDVSCEAVR